LFKERLFSKLFLFAYLFVSVILIFRFTGQIYGVNDDVIIQNWLSGSYTGKPEFMIRGSATPKLLFGTIVSSLYSAFPQINWYSIALLGAVLISWFIYGSLALKTKNFFLVIFYAVISFLHLLWFIPSPTYTAASVMLSFTTLIYISYSILEKNISSKFLLVFPAYAFAFLIRPESFFLGTAVAIPFLTFAIIVNRSELKNILRKLLLPSFLCLLIIGGDAGFEKSFYSQNKEWENYREWEILRYKIQANAPEIAVDMNPQEFGWTRSEVELFKSYNYIDKNNFSVDKFQKLVQDTSGNKLDLNSVFFLKAHQKIFDSDVNWEWTKLISIITFSFLLFAFLLFPRIQMYVSLLASAYLILYLVMLYVAGFLRQPERVQVSVVFLAILVSSAGFIFSRNYVNRLSVDHFTILSLLLTVMISTAAFLQASHFVNKIGKEPDFFWTQQLDYLGKFPSDSIFIGNASQFRNNWASPYIVSNHEIEDRIFTFGWHNFSPHWIERAEKLGLNADDMFKSVIEDSRVYWVSDKPTMEYVVRYMEENQLMFSGPENVGVMKNFSDEYVVWNFNE
jgi:hypothetical protein